MTYEFNQISLGLRYILENNPIHKGCIAMYIMVNIINNLSYFVQICFHKYHEFIQNLIFVPFKFTEGLF